MTISKESMINALTTAVEASKSLEDKFGIRLHQSEIVKLALTCMISEGKTNGFSEDKRTGGNGKDLETEALKLSFGKYKGLTVLEIAKTGDMGYVAWLKNAARSARLRSESSQVLEQLPTPAEVAN